LFLIQSKTGNVRLEQFDLGFVGKLLILLWVLVFVSIAIPILSSGNIDGESGLAQINSSGNMQALLETRDNDANG